MLRIYVGDTFVELSDSDMEESYISEGKEGIVYRYGDKALKIYKEFCNKGRLDEDETLILSEISTKRVLLPRDLIYGEDRVTFRGYATKFIEKQGIDKIIDMNIMQFVDELDIINEDLITLAKNKVYVYDFVGDNIFYDGNIYFGDPGSYTILESMPFDFVSRNNNYNLNCAVLGYMFAGGNMEAGQFTMMFNSFEKYKYIGDQIRKNADKNESVKQYVKRIFGC